MNIYQINIPESEELDFIVANHSVEAVGIYRSHTGNTDTVTATKLTDEELESNYLVDFNETEPDELDEDDEDFDPTYNPDEWIGGGKIIETFGSYLKRQTKPHYFTSNDLP